MKENTFWCSEAISLVQFYSVVRFDGIHKHQQMMEYNRGILSDFDEAPQLPKSG